MCEGEIEVIIGRGITRRETFEAYVKSASFRGVKVRPPS
jgi:hypothetical protein